MWGAEWTEKPLASEDDEILVPSLHRLEFKGLVTKECFFFFRLLGGGSMISIIGVDRPFPIKHDMVAKRGI